MRITIITVKLISFVTIMMVSFGLFAQDCTTNPFDPRPLPLCGPPDGGGGGNGPIIPAQIVRTNNGNGLYYMSSDGNIWQSWNNGSGSVGSGWNSANIRAIAGAPIGDVFSTLFAYTDSSSGNQNVIYVGQDQHLHLLWWNGDPWRTIDITSAASGPTVLVATPMVATNPGNDFYYIGTDGNVYIAWNSSSSSTASGWHTASITTIAGAPAANTTSGLYGYTDPVSGNLVVLYVGTDQHLHLLWWNGDPWRTIDLSSTTGGPTVEANVAPVRANNSNNLFCLGMDGNVYIVFNNGSTSNASGWHTASITTIAGAPLGAAANDFFGYTDPVSGNLDVLYAGTDRHLHLLWWNGDPWHTVDITSQNGGHNIAAGFPIVQTNVGNGLYFVGSDANIYISWNNGSSSTASGWNTASITTIAGAPIASQGTTLYGYTDPVSGNLNVFYVDTNQHLRLLWWNGDPWRTVDITAQTGGPVVN
jgi:hypothetical protein